MRTAFKPSLFKTIVVFALGHPRPQVLAAGLYVLRSLGHELAKLLRLTSIRLHLGLRMPALKRQHFLDALGFGEFAGQRKTRFCVLFGETRQCTQLFLAP